MTILISCHTVIFCLSWFVLAPVGILYMHFHVTPQNIHNYLIIKRQKLPWTCTKGTLNQNETNRWATFNRHESFNLFPKLPGNASTSCWLANPCFTIWLRKSFVVEFSHPSLSSPSCCWYEKSSANREQVRRGKQSRHEFGKISLTSSSFIKMSWFLSFAASDDVKQPSEMIRICSNIYLLWIALH